MRTVDINVYKFSELLPAAKARVREREMRHGYPFANDAINSLKALAKHFDCTLRDWQIHFFDDATSGVRFNFADLTENEIEERLAKLGAYDPETLRGLGDCVLTGYCADEDAIDGFRRAWFEGERDLKQLLSAGFKTWLKAVQADCLAQYTDEALSETFDANEVEFLANGEVYCGN